MLISKTAHIVQSREENEKEGEGEGGGGKGVRGEALKTHISGEKEQGKQCFP